MGKKTSGSQKVTQSNVPWGGVQPGLKTSYDLGTSLLYKQLGLPLYLGNTQGNATYALPGAANNNQFGTGGTASYPAPLSGKTGLNGGQVVYQRGQNADPIQVPGTNLTLPPGTNTNPNGLPAPSLAGASLYEQTSPYGYYPGQTVAGFDPTQTLGQDLTINRALNGSPIVNAAKGQVGTTLTGSFLGQDPGNSTYADLSKGINLPGNSTYNLFSSGALGMDPLSQSLTAMANGSQVGANPYLDALVNRSSDAIRNQVQGQFTAGGRTGSGANQDVLARAIGDNANTMYSAAYDADRNRQLQASGLLEQARQADLNNRMQGAAGLNQGAVANAGIRAQGASGLDAAFQNERQRMMSASALAPDLAQTDYTNLGALMGVGQQRQTQNQAMLDDAKARFDFSQNAPWDLLNRYVSLLSGSGNLLGGAGTGTKSTPTYSNPLGSFLGMAGTGVDIAGKLGLLGGGSALAAAGPALGATLSTASIPAAASLLDFLPAAF